MKTKVVISDNNAIFRRSLRFIIEQQPDMEIIGEISNGRTTLNQIRKLSPDIVFTVIESLALSSLDLIYQITSRLRYAKVIALSEYPDMHLASKALRAGAASYLSKNCSSEDIKSALHAVLENKLYLTDKTENLIPENPESQFSTPDFSASSILTKRQLEVLRLISEGNTSKQISSYLKISLKTVESHRQQIKDKLYTNNVIELTKFAIREGLTTV